MGIEDLWDKRVYIETYGCTYNFGDTEKLTKVLLRQRCTIENSADNAEAVIINTCTVVAPTERRMLRTLAGYCNRELFVAGCMPVVQDEKIRAVCNPHIITPDEIHAAFRRLECPVLDSTGIVQIARGCLGECTYCITRKARGRLTSFSMEEILSQVAAAAGAGIPEIRITAQDVSAWGKDMGSSLSELLSGISRIPGNFYVRLGMMNPATVKPILSGLLDAFSGGKIFRFLHLPVQSGSDRVLARMGRGYTANDFIRICDAFRTRFPDITLATDIIVGFPGETEEDFLQSLAIIERTLPNKVNVTRFSKREMTDIAIEKDFTDYLKKKRSRMLLSHAERVYHRVNAGWLGKELSFVVTERLRKGSVVARAPNYIGIVLQESLPVGYRGHARLREDKTYYFTGDLISGTTVAP
jgi:MiaB/RimO family radical SAM methylthiotransferase